MEKFLPSWVMTDRQKDFESEEETGQTACTKQLAKALGVQTKRPQSTMPITMWMLAYDAYSLAAAVTEQWPLDPPYILLPKFKFATK